ncbi:O-antigen ligase family protein [Granulicella tundricola]|uniref:O-antigen polymerase n=1 Tax=Granulicella tundricola (strain ATCC BAA-1859 / DSM 23138 / MP5ACTX9) TaxID=1198114 RepID=E8X6T5_GRATM|nr:O-antigen ligase family protein [Granulicella tundricola]ADW71235.1 O-antigen polymerase [Granulicella tundricola MP5ACTX9]
MSTRAMTIPDVMTGAPREPAAYSLLRAKRFWVVLLTIGFWFARPYYFPLNAMEERNADAHAIVEQASLTRQISLPLMGLVACYMLWRIPRRRRAQGFHGALAIAAGAYFALAVGSLLWTADPALGLKRLTVFFLDVLLVIAVAKSFRVIELAKLGFFACGSVALIAFCVDVFVTHTFAPFDPDYRLLGVMSGNSQGMNITVFMFCGLTLLLKYPQRTRSLTAALVAGAILLFYTHSRAAAGACVVMSLFFFKQIIDTRVQRRSNVVALFLLFACVLPAIIATGSGERVLQTSFMMGRSDTENTATVSNRTPLWADVSDFISERPLTGYGFHAFWSTDHISTISKHLGWVVPNAHNTYLDETLSAGVGGALLYAFLLWGSLVVAWKRYRRNAGPETIFPLAMLGWIFITGWVESVALDPFLPTFLAYVCLAQCMLPESPYRRREVVVEEAVLGTHPGFARLKPAGAVMAKKDAVRLPAALRRRLAQPHSPDESAS